MLFFFSFFCFLLCPILARGYLHHFVDFHDFTPDDVVEVLQRAMLEAHDEGYDATPKRIGVVHQLSVQNDFFELNHDVLHAHAHLQFHAIPATVDPRTLLSAEDAGGATASSGGGGGADGGGGGGGGGSQYVSANEALPTFHALLLIIDDKSLLHHFAFHAPMPCVSLLHALYPLADLYFIGRHLFDLRARAAGASEAPSTAFTMETFAPERLIYLGGHNAYARIIPQQVFFRHFIMDGLLYTPKYWTQQCLSIARATTLRKRRSSSRATQPFFTCTTATTTMQQ